MLLSLWHYLKGYVIIEITGSSPERFVNLAARNGVFLWEIKTFRKGFCAHVSVQGFFLLRSALLASHCRVKIISRHGLPFLCKRAFKRASFSFGALFFAVSLWILSLFVWQVEINSDTAGSPETALEGAVLEFCAEEGLSAGSLRSGIDTKLLADEIRLEFPQISWASIHIRGTKATVSFTYAIEEPELSRTLGSSDIVAKKPGVIKRITARAGTPAVFPGQVVDTGDVLIKGEVIIMEGEEEKGRESAIAQGEVWAETETFFEAYLPLSYTEREYEGETKYDFSLEFFGQRLNIIRPDMQGEYEVRTIKEYRPALGDFRLPFSLRRDALVPYTTKEYSRTPDEAKKELTKELESRANALLKGESEAQGEREVQNNAFSDEISYKNPVIEDKTIEFYSQNGYIYAKMKLLLTEDISQEAMP
ncbi:MAG: sporulation protein YqfD [Firmicutes bacterium]|nr:sporulation protein YqfD [Bacillota bacterium]